MRANVGEFGLRQQASGRTNCRLSSGVGSALTQPGHQYVAGAGGDCQQRVISPRTGVAVEASALLGQSVGRADDRVQVNGEWCIAGSGIGPPDACQQLPAPRPSWRTWPQLKLRRKVPRVDGALTVPPRVQAVPPVRNTSASSMQSPPASADATRVIILSPVFARPGALPRSRRCWTSSRRPRCWARVNGRISPALATRRWSSKEIWMRSGWSSGSIFWVLLVWGGVCVSKTIIPEAQEHFVNPSARRDTHLFGGLGLIGKVRLTSDRHDYGSIGFKVSGKYWGVWSEYSPQVRIYCSQPDDGTQQQSDDGNDGNDSPAATNNSATGGPGITGLPRVGALLTATTSGIADADGLENASFSYQWVRHDLGTGTNTDVPGAAGSTYTVTRQDRDRAIKVRADFTDDAGNDETLTSFAVLVLPPVNTPAAGAPAVNGTVRVGEELSVDTSGVSDENGMTGAAFGYQWIRRDGATGADIENATGASYALVDADEGRTIQVRVRFTDDGYMETLTSAATDEVAAGVPTETPRDEGAAGQADEGEEPPAKPTGLTGTVNHDAVSLSWDDPGDASITGYQVLRRDKDLHEIGEFLVHVEDTGSADATYTDTDVEPSVRYVYRIKAWNASGLSELSEWFDADIPPD